MEKNWKNEFKNQFSILKGWKNVFSNTTTKDDFKFKKFSLEGHWSGIDCCLFHRSLTNGREYIISTADSKEEDKSDIVVWDIQAEEKSIFKKTLDFYIEKIEYFGDDDFLITNSRKEFIVFRLFDFNFTTTFSSSISSNFLDHVIIDRVIVAISKDSVFRINEESSSFQNISSVESCEFIHFLKNDDDGNNRDWFDVLVVTKTDSASLKIFSINFNYRNNVIKKISNVVDDLSSRIPFLCQIEHYFLTRNHKSLLLGCQTPVFPFKKFVIMINLRNEREEITKDKIEITGEFYGYENRNFIGISETRTSIICLEESTSKNTETLYIISTLEYKNNTNTEILSLRNQFQISAQSLYHSELRLNKYIFSPYILLSQYSRRQIILYQFSGERKKIHESLDPIIRYFFSPCHQYIIIPSRDATIAIIDLFPTRYSIEEEQQLLEKKIKLKIIPRKGVWKGKFFKKYMKIYPHLKYFLRNLAMRNTIDILREGKFYSEGKLNILDKNKLMKTSTETILWKSIFNLSHFFSSDERVINEEEEEDTTFKDNIIPPIPNPIFSSGESRRKTEVKLFFGDCLKLVERFHSPGKKIVLLNCANRFLPNCERFGYNTLEENLHTRTNLCCSLDDVFKWDCERKWEYPFECGDIVHSQNVLILRGDESEDGYNYIINKKHEEEGNYVDVISISAICSPRIFYDEEYDQNRLRKREEMITSSIIENIFLYSFEKKFNVLVLTPLGCGKFRNPSGHIAEIYLRMVKKYHGCFESVLFVSNTKLVFEEFVSVFDEFQIDNV